MAESLMDTITAQVERVESAGSELTHPPATPEPTAAVTPETKPEAAAAATPAAAKSVAQLAVQSGRDEAGRFTKKDGELAAKVAAKPETKPVPEAAPAKARAARPSSWKKELWEHWEKLDPSVADYIAQREGEYASGVSTYKREWDRARPLLEALQPHAETMKTVGMAPEEFVGALAATDHTLRFGSAEEKLRAFAQFAQDYQIPLQNLLIQGADGKVYFNKNYFQSQAPSASQASGTLDPKAIDQRVREGILAMRAEDDFRQFLAAKDKDGNPSYPHFEEVRATMDGILRAGLAADLKSAYDTALAMPAHRAILEADQATQREKTRGADEAERAKVAAEAAKRARAQTVSPRTQTPTGMVEGAGGRKSLRETIAEGIDSVGVGGRV